MSTTTTTPKANIPIGRVTIANVVYDVDQTPEFVRFFFDLARRAGGTTALTNTDLAGLLASLEATAATPASDPQAQEAMRAVDELRNEIASVRSDCDGLRNQLAEREAEISSLRSTSDLRQRVEQLEGIVL